MLVIHKNSSQSFIFSSGQSTIEYILILAFVVFITVKIVSSFSDLFGSGSGSINHILSSHLKVGVCASECWFESYFNGYKSTP